MTSYRSCADVHRNVVACTSVYRIVKDKAQITVMIKRSKTLYRHDQDLILDDQDLIPVADNSTATEGSSVSTTCVASGASNMHSTVTRVACTLDRNSNSINGVVYRASRV